MRSGENECLTFSLFSCFLAAFLSDFRDIFSARSALRRSTDAFINDKLDDISSRDSANRARVFEVISVGGLIVFGIEVSVSKYSVG